MSVLKLTQIGDSVGVILPPEVLARLKLRTDDTLDLIECSDGMRLTPYDPTFEDQMQVARNIMSSRWAALRDLPK